MNTLTDRYVDATLRGVPQDKRVDIERELRASIADAIDARVEAGTSSAEAEVAVLTELGDPARLAAGYADRPLYLIGPALFLDYVRLLRVLLAVIVPIASVAVLIAQLVKDGPTFDHIGTVVGTAVTTALHVAFWTTLSFAVLERLPAGERPVTGAWTPDRLPEVRESHRTGIGELVGEVLWVAVVVTALLLAPRLSPKQDAAGEPINILHPWLWESGFVYLLIGLLVVGLVAPFASYAVGRWTAARAVGAAVFEVAGPIALIWLAATDRIINPAFAPAMAWPDMTKWINISVIVVGVVAIGGALVKAGRRAIQR